MSMPTDFPTFFHRATSHAPYPYQERLATHLPPDALAVPTGCGKTAALIGAWMWRRFGHPEPAVRESTPRRFVYCLPMRVLVEQTAGVARTMRSNLGRDAKLGVHVLLGGEADDDWVNDPDRDAILVGTQDMLLSRALNRGYSASRFRWPRVFGLLHNDAYWVFDEPQLMGIGRTTAGQLEGIRRRERHFGNVHTTFASATFHPEWVDSVDFPSSEMSVLTLDEDDRNHPFLAPRLEARKRLESAAEFSDKPARLAASIREAHIPGSLTVAIVNRVESAVALFRELDKNRAPACLLHSRFRPAERRAALARLLADPPPEGLIAISTQVLEAGVDVDARTLFFESAPWSSIVQRLGRCNRAGGRSDATAYWIDVPDTRALPYRAEDLALSRERLEALCRSPLTSSELAKLPLQPPERPAHVLRRADLRDLFDTSSDISGLDVDVSRYVRESDSRDIQVLWRVIGDGPAPEEPAPAVEEICPVPVEQLREYLKGRNRRAWLFDPLEERWVRLRDATRPGMQILLDAAGGGYSELCGFDPSSTDRVAPASETIADGEPSSEMSGGASRLPDGNDSALTVDNDPSAAAGGAPTEAISSDPASIDKAWITIAEHTDSVVLESEDLRDLAPAYSAALVLAARWHDAGKSHPAFQEFLRHNAPAPPRSDALWAKSPRRGGRHVRKCFRHELASALALLRHAPSGADLAAYLVASHHGKVRLAIRSLPGEQPHPKGHRFACGVWDGDTLPSVDLGGGVITGEVTLDLAAMELGRHDGEQSWAERMLRVLDELGPFRLAYLEALLRAADARASRKVYRRSEGSGELVASAPTAEGGTDV